ncbi:MAG TPA: nuclear transport factor 2 family protein [Solirubrobacteraceae bacterium]
MPWSPELFSSPVLERVEERQRRKPAFIPYFDGLMAGELDALAKSFAVEPELHVPLRGRIKGTSALEAYASETSSWLKRHNAVVEDVAHVMTERHGFEETVLHFDGDGERIALPVAIVADHLPDGKLEELRIYFSNWPLAGGHVNRPPLLQPDPQLRLSDVVGEYQRALAAGDVEEIVAAFEPDGHAREPAGGQHVYRGHDNLRSFYEQLFSNDGGIPLEHCAAIDDGHSCALEYNVVRWGQSELTPQAGVAVYVRGPSGKLAAARIYDDVDPPLHAHA